MSDTAPEKPTRNSRRARVERIEDHAADVRSLFLRIDEGRRLKFVPGQFISVSIPLDDETRTRAYSITSAAEDGNLVEICFNRVEQGRGVSWLFDRKVGDTIDLIGPFGVFTMERAPEVETVLIAEGTAIAPLRPMLHLAASTDSHAPIFVLYAADSREHVLYLSELEEIASRDPNVAMETVVMPGADPASLYDRLLAEADARWVKGDDVRTRRFYICGVGKGVLRIRDLLRGAGYERRSVRYEQW